MRIWRLSRHASLDGAGGLKVGGRWHTRGQLILYCAANPAAAILEQVVHQEIRRPEALQGYRLLAVDLRENVSADRVEIADLPDDWMENVEATRRVGDDWLRAGDAAVLEVPSAIVPETHNVLINPRQADARRLRLVMDEPFVFDPRLTRP